MSLELDDKAIAKYLSKLFHHQVSIIVFKKLGVGVLGVAYLIEFEVNGEKKKIVLKTLSQRGFGQDFPADRANTLLYAHTVYNKLANHVKSYDAGAIFTDGSLTSLGDAGEFFILMDFVSGEEYAKDLDRIKETGKLQALDVERARILAEYEAKVHTTKKDDPILYVRRIRDLIGRGDCITGIIDTYPKDERTYSFTSVKEFENIEKKCIEWRWKIKDKTHRLCQVHGDIHPFNILWQSDKTFILLDRSRGEWGEAADDVSCLSINYIFWSLMAYGRLDGSFERLFEFFIRRYIELTGDDELMEVIQPFYAFRSLVVAHPLFYPKISMENRRRIFNFLNSILETEKFDYKEVNSYIKG
jgi:hypothetical protein